MKFELHTVTSGSGKTRDYRTSADEIKFADFSSGIIVHSAAPHTIREIAP